jgi:hypothetical protein
MKWLSNLIATIGENTEFVAFMAHSGFAYFVVSLFSGLHQYIAAGICLVVFAAKEFWFDIHYEQSPPQTFLDSLDDYVGYCIGIVLAVAIAYFNI